jgi:serine/threonine protein kinase
MGTPEYMAPEVMYQPYQVEGVTGKEKDWYSFGIIM